MNGPVAEVYAKDADETWVCGSGYHLGGGLLLTARHVVARQDGHPRGELRVRLGGINRLVACRLVWPDSPGAGRAWVDAALLRVTGQGWTPPQTRPVRWGQLVTSGPSVPCTGQGYPQVQATTEFRDVEQLTGVIHPRTTSKAGLISIAVDNPPQRIRESVSPWAGMSGTAVFCHGGLLTAVVVRDPEGFASTRLVAVPIAALAGDAEFRRLVENAIGEPLVLVPVELQGLFARVEPVTSPAQLLRADVQAVRFRGRDSELAALMQWCEEPGEFSGRLLVGPGGQGKTRLGVQLATLLTGQGWVAGLVRRKPDQDALGALASSLRPVMLVLDYAETRPRLAADLTDAARDAQVPVRLLMLARNTGDWITAAAADHPALGWLPDTPVMNLPVLEVTPAAAARRGRRPSPPSLLGSPAFPIWLPRTGRPWPPPR